MKNGNYCDCNRKIAIKFGGFKKKQYLCRRKLQRQQMTEQELIELCSIGESTTV